MAQPSMPSETHDQPFAWGIVGAGAIAKRFAADLRHADGATVVAVASRDGVKAAQFARDVGGARAHATLEALLADPAVDAVYIATPNHLHAEQAIRAIEAGKAVLVEKPIATTTGDADAVFAAAARRRVFVMEALWSRFLPAVAAARSAIEAGAIGQVEQVAAELAYRRDEQADGRFFDPALGGGAALDLGVYPLSIAMFLLGEPDSIDGRWRAARTGVDMRSEFMLRFGAARADLSCGFDRDAENVLRVFGSGGVLTLSAPFLGARRMTIDAAARRDRRLVGTGVPSAVGRLLQRLPLPGRQTRRFGFPGSGLQFEALHVAEAVRAGRTQSVVMPPAASLAVLRAIECVRSAPPRD